MGEEWGQDGSKHFARHHADEIDFALVGEPTDCDAVIRTKGALWPTLRTDGIAVHGSKPELGDNAITKMANVLGVIDSEFREHLKRPEWCDDLLGHSTVNIGVIRGGSRANIVPDSCEADLDIRMTPAFYRAGGAEILQRFLDENRLPVAMAARAPSPPLDTAPGHPAVKALLAAGAKPVGAPWFCDATWLAAGGIPGAAAGPGSIDQAHTADEWIAIGELERGVAFYRRFLEAF
jgi:acetylornithine deacetylase